MFSYSAETIATYVTSTHSRCFRKANYKSYNILGLGLGLGLISQVKSQSLSLQLNQFIPEPPIHHLALFLVVQMAVAMAVVLALLALGRIHVVSQLI